MSRVAEAEAPAKVNLFLRVHDARPDGYHEIETLFQAIDLADRVRVELGGGGEGVELEVVGNADLGPPLENLAHRAATRLLAELGQGGGARITLDKRIPVGAGLGGGSSDAAAVLRALAALRSLPLDDPRLLRIAAELGSDVPFFLGESPLAIGRGRGELLAPLPPLPGADLVLVSPPVHVSTAWAYRALDDARRGRGSRGGAQLGPPPSTWKNVIASVYNDFQDVVAEAHVDVRRSLEALEAHGAEAVLMSGSGSSSFGIFPDRTEAERAAVRLKSELGWPCLAARTLTALPLPTVS